MDIKTYLTELEKLVNIDSGSENLEGLNKMAAYFSTRFRDLGWIVKEYNLAPESGTLLVCANREAEHYDVMLVGHLDTVFPAGTAAQRPYTTDGENAYGPGVADMKHGCLMMYYLMAELPKELNDRLNILVVFNPDEEIGSVHSRGIYSEFAKITDYAYLYEARGVTGNYCIQRPGAIQFVTEFTGIPGHCGYVFKNGAKSAISEMAKWIVALDTLQNKERETTVNIGVVSGGIKPNVVAEKATMTVDIRFQLPEEAPRIEATIAQLLADAQERGVTAEIQKKRMKMPLYPTEAGRAYFQRIAELAQSQGMNPGFASRGGLSDANIIAQYGPICLDGMGPAGDSCHSPKEYMTLDSIEPVFAFSRLLLKDLADNKA